jgi:hypothetical protein
MQKSALGVGQRFLLQQPNEQLLSGTVKNTIDELSQQLLRDFLM